MERKKKNRRTFNLPVKVVEEADEVKTKFDETLLLVTRERTENLCRIVHVVLGQDPVGKKWTRSVRKREREKKKGGLSASGLTC